MKEEGEEEEVKEEVEKVGEEEEEIRGGGGGITERSDRWWKIPFNEIVDNSTVCMLCM